LAQAEPGRTDYRRDLPVYNEMGDAFGQGENPCVAEK
jgi:hypothetical protein